MNFSKAWGCLLNGKKIKRPKWGGYWALEDDTIMMHCKDGNVIDIRATEDVRFTFGNVAACDWEVV